LLISSNSLTSISISSIDNPIDETSFDGCSNLTTVTYFGTNDLCDNPSFQIFSNAEHIYVPVRYNSSEFCGHEVTFDPTMYGNLSDKNNNCYEVVIDIVTNTPSIPQKPDAVIWENQTTQCVKYECVVGNGDESRNICNGNSDICMNGNTCESKESVMDGKEWRIEIEVVATNATDVNIAEIIEVVAETTGADESNVKVGVEMNEVGEVVRVIVYVNDEDTAKNLEVAVNECSEITKECQGFMKTAKEARVVKNTAFLAEADKRNGRTIMCMVAMMMVMISLFIF